MNTPRAMNLQRTPLTRLKGRQVVLKRDVRNRGGHVFPQGTIMIIIDKYAGLELGLPEIPHLRVITRVSYDAIELVEESLERSATENGL